MQVDKAEYDRYVKKLAKKREADQRATARTNLEQLLQAEVRMENLTNDADWNIFLQYVQSALNKTEAQLAEAVKSLSSRNVSSPDEIMHYKFLVTELTGRVSALRGVIELPAQIKESGEQAKSLMERMGEVE